MLCGMSWQILYSSSSYVECRSCCLTGAMNDYELFSSESVNSEVVCAMRNVAADTLLLQQLCGMLQLLSDWGHEQLQVVQLGVCEFRGHMCYAECRSCCLTGTMNGYESCIMFGAPGPSSILQAHVNTI